MFKVKRLNSDSWWREMVMEFWSYKGHGTAASTETGYTAPQPGLNIGTSFTEVVNSTSQVYPSKRWRKCFSVTSVTRCRHLPCHSGVNVVQFDLVINLDASVNRLWIKEKLDLKSAKKAVSELCIIFRLSLRLSSFWRFSILWLFELWSLLYCLFLVIIRPM